MMTVVGLFIGLNLLSLLLIRGGQAYRNAERCSGRKILYDKEGLISDGPSNYTEYLKCEWLIDAGSPNKTIHLIFENMTTECSFDYLFIYDGKSYNSRLIATLSGDSHPTPITAHSGYMLLYLFSDRNYVRPGFDARYKILDCPWNCSNRGICKNHVCHCNAGYSGDGCEVTDCPFECGEHGDCKFHSYKLQYCHCKHGYIGQKCDLHIHSNADQGHWYSIQDVASGSFSPRTAHTSVYASNCIWMFGGFDLNIVLDELLRYCMSENAWESVNKLHQKGERDWPQARSGHAMDVYGDGFFIFGGLLSDGSHSNELWFFNISSMAWSLCANESEIMPETITDHTLTTVGDYLYVVGGKSEQRIYIDSIFRISAKSPENWERVLVKGGKYPPKRLVGHTTLYHKHSRSLIVFGGYKQESALISDRTSKIQVFHIDDSYWSQLYNHNWRKDSIPRDRAYHTAVLIGNYLAVYGGNTHKHEELEICYSEEIFFYHLGCHVWLNHSFFNGNATPEGMPVKGRFGHSAVAANGNIMFIMGGYSGQVLGDLIAYKVPSAIADYKCSLHNNRVCPMEDNASFLSDHCEKYPSHNQRLCQDDPECVFCNHTLADRESPSCIHRSRIELCAGQVHNPSDRCPGICPALHTCGACVSQGKGADLTDEFPRRHIYIEECSWCVKEAECQQRSAPKGTCMAPNETTSGIQGWWGGLSANLTTLLQCQVEDIPAGLHFVKYRDPANYSYPDELSINRKTMGAMGYIASKRIEHVYFYTSKFLGFIHPLNAQPANAENLTLYLSLQHAKAHMFLSTDQTEANTESVIKTEEEAVYNNIQAKRAYNRKVFPIVAKGHKYFIEQVTEQTRRTPELATTEVTIGWNAHLNSSDKIRPLTYEFLEPFSNGNCSSSYNCLSCLTDTLCSWCEVKRSCMPRNVSEDQCKDGYQHQYMITSPSECPECEGYVQCTVCAADPLCEWVIDTGHCTRRLRHPQKAVTDSSKCPPPCHERTKCSDCITSEKGECAWCENTQLCLPFSDYVSRYNYGQCTSWIDISGPTLRCRSCESHKTCGSCLNEFGCGWCSLEENALKGVCVEGDFKDISGNMTCSQHLVESWNLSSSQSISWAYDICPDVDECQQNLHECHANASCINIYGDYRCDCNRGFEGDGIFRCDETCYYDCHNGKCSGPPDFLCECDLGWSNHSCDVNCGCNNHSTCNTGVGICDACQHRTSGATCDECMPGAYGNPLDPQGCFPCMCNGHGDPSLGECNKTTGQCFCTDNTHGFYCEQCQPAYYGNPGNGGKCYLRCDNRVFITNVTQGALGSYNGSGVKGGGHSYCLWILSVFADIMHRATDSKSVPVLSLTIEGDTEIECGQGAVYVYNGIPDFVYGGAGDKMENQRIGEFCGLSPGRDVTVYGTQGTITVLFEGDLTKLRSKGHNGRFNATFRAHACPDQCHGNQICVDGNCVCKEGYWGQNCILPVCPFNCSEALGWGYCLNGICICNSGFGGPHCAEKISKEEMRLQLLTDSGLASLPIELNPDQQIFSDQTHGPSPRAGHSLTTCGDGMIYMYGGYSSLEGIMNDMWMYNVSAKTWRLIETELDQKPIGSYYHAAACIPLLKMIYVFGGFSRTEDEDRGKARPVHATNTLWKFNIESHAWTLDQSPPWLPALAGHTLTHVGTTNLMLIGGFSSENYFNDKVYEYNVSNGLMAWQEHDRKSMHGSFPTGLYGHSAVFDPLTHTVYVFGGYIFRSEHWYMSQELMTLDTKEKKWNMLQPEENSKWEGRVFHRAVHMGEFMVVVGGLTTGSRFASYVLVYRYSCNTWLRLQFTEFELDDILFQSPVSGVGLDAVSVGDVIYIFGGFIGVTLGTFSQLTMPLDLCFHIKDNTCNMLGCQRCSVFTNSENKTVCLDVHRPKGLWPPGCKDTEERLCNLRNQAQNKCKRYKTCSQCLATHPRIKDQGPNCAWCSNCRTPSCVTLGETCLNQCSSPISQTQTQDCMENSCAASDCEKCEKLGNCFWSRHFQRSTEAGRYFTPQPMYNWNCVTSGLKPSATGKYYSAPPELCPARCHTHRTCESCLKSHGSEGGSSECMWSEMLQECMAPAYLPLRCTLGECHFVRAGREYTCPTPCETYTKCADCIASPDCGWCAFGGMNGQGVCMPGGILGPTQGGACSEGNFSISLPFVSEIVEGKGKPEIPSSHIAHPIWSYDTCQPENECLNNHHTCNNITQNCYDTLKHFRCDCKEGYILIANKCEPVCHQSCVKGVCIKPDHCQCDFGYVGSNCSVECLCNKHSNCKSVAEPGKCLKCENNTRGDRCEECLPGFVGNPEEGGRCIPCREFCNNHTDKCMTKDDYNLSLVGNLAKSKSFYKNQAQCFDCQHNTTGEHCGSCISGHFRKMDEPKTKPCRECQCNGHGNVCNMDTGENCQCKNNTETMCEKDVECWEMQCANCKEYFLGTPTNGHQCYRQMNVDRDYCFDPDTQNNCNQFPKALQMGKTVFFVVQPKYLNVDIRITIDVTVGSADVFLSNKKDTYQVFNDEFYRMHTIFLDKTYASGRAGLARRSIMINSGEFDDEVIRRSLQLHESGSVLITDKVPDYLKLKTTDTEFYKLSQFESLKKAAAKPGDRSRKKDSKANSSNLYFDFSESTDKDDDDSSDKEDDEDEAEDALDEDRKGGKKLNKRKLKHKKGRKTQKNFHESVRQKMSYIQDFKPDDIEKLFYVVSDKSSNLENESVLPQHYENVLNKWRNQTAAKKRQRRGTVVTDANKEGKSLAGLSGTKMGEIEAGELNTYITVGQQNSMLVVRDVRFRLVITLPRDQHDLRTSKFFIIVRSRGGSPDNTTYGNLYFRQDQPHIDLFVFFSVFFSCFFLFLAVCVMLWKMKQTFDARRSRQMREREMECMASRPFARILVLVEHDEPLYLPLHSGLIRRRSRLSRYRNQYYNNNEINTLSSLPPPRELRVIPIAIEPTEDGLASVGTVLFQLPGGSAAPSHLCLGSALTTRITPPVLTQKSANIRRRTSASSC